MTIIELTHRWSSYMEKIVRGNTHSDRLAGLTLAYDALVLYCAGLKNVVLPYLYIGDNELRLVWHGDPESMPVVVKHSCDHITVNFMKTVTVIKDRSGKVVGE